jgi:hypothetical protein
MFKWRSEGEPCKKGFNIYPPKDKGSAGFILVVWCVVFRVRYSKRTKEWYCNLNILDKNGFYYR